VFGYKIIAVISENVIVSRNKRHRIIGSKTCKNQAVVALHSPVPSRPVAFIFLRPKASPGTVAHESWHAVRYMLRWACADLEEEVVAYYLGYLVNKIWWFTHTKA